MECLGLDVGSSSIKGAVLDLERASIRNVVREPFPPPLEGLPPGHYEVAPDAIVFGVERVLARLAEASPEARGIFVSGQMGGVILVDAAGRPLTNYLSWRDQRTLAPCPEGGTFRDAVRRRWSDDEFGQLGRELQPGSTTSLLFWLAAQGWLPALARPATIADFAMARLCGTVPRMHPTQAIGMLDLRTGDWHTEALARLDLDRLDWPRLADLQEPVVDWGPRRIPCFAALGDQQCALYGAGLERDELSINVSTGSQVSRRTARPHPGAFQTRPYLDGDFLNTITHLPAGRSLNVFVELLTEIPRAAGVPAAEPWPYIARAVETAAADRLTCDLSFFQTPFGERGRIDGITTDNLTVGSLFRAAFEAMVETYAVCAERLRPAEGWRRLVLSGGLTQSVPLLRRLIEARFALPAREAAVQEETLTGLLAAARAVMSSHDSQAGRRIESDFSGGISPRSMRSP